MKSLAFLCVSLLLIVVNACAEGNVQPERKLDIPLALISGVKTVKVEAGLNAEGQPPEIAYARLNCQSTTIVLTPKPDVVDPFGKLNVALVENGKVTPVLPRDGAITVVVPASQKPSDASLRIEVAGGKVVKGRSGTMSFKFQLTFDREVRWPAPPAGSHKPFNHDVKVIAPYQVLMGFTRFGLLATSLDPDRKLAETFYAPSVAMFQKDEKPPRAFIDGVEVGKVSVTAQGQSLSLPYSEKLWARNPDVTIVYESTLPPVKGNPVAQTEAGGRDLAVAQLVH